MRARLAGTDVAVIFSEMGFVAADAPSLLPGKITAPHCRPCAELPAQLCGALPCKALCWAVLLTNLSGTCSSWACAKIPHHCRKISIPVCREYGGMFCLTVCCEKLLLPQMIQVFRRQSTNWLISPVNRKNTSLTAAEVPKWGTAGWLPVKP